ncbi:MAG TPA: condensation domain-containing protein, partial [Vicinamibacteria bacterium]
MTMGGAAASEAAVREAETPRLCRRIDRESFPLSLNQRDIWFQAQIHSQAGLNNHCVQVTLTGPLDRDRFRGALQAVIDRHEALRAAFIERDGAPRQRIVSGVRLRCPERDLSALEPVARAEAVRERSRELAAEPFDLREAPLLRAELLRLEPERHVLLFVFHNLVLDGLYMAQLLEEVSSVHQLAGGEAALPSPEVQYPDFAAWQDERLRRGLMDEHAAYWRRQLEEPLPVVTLCADHDAGASRSFALANLERPIPAGVSARLHTLGKAYRTTPFRVVLAAFEALLHRLTGRTDLLLAIPFSTRPPQLRELLGSFGQAAPIRVSLCPEGRFSSLLADVNRQLADGRAHVEYPLVEALRSVRAGRDLSRPLFPIYVSQERDVELTLGGARMTTGAAFVHGGVYDLMLAVCAGDPGLGLTFCYARELFEASTMEHLAGALGRVLEQVASDPEVRIGDLQVVGEAERERLFVLGDGGAGRGEGPWAEERIAERAREQPEAVAVVCGEERLRYGELEARAQAVAGALMESGVGLEDRVGVLGRRGVGMLGAVVGVMTAGAAFVPLDPLDPPERLRAV